MAHSSGTASALGCGSWSGTSSSVDDIDTVVDELGTRGASFLRPDGFHQDQKGVARGAGPVIAGFADPAGNLL